MSALLINATDVHAAPSVAPFRPMGAGALDENKFRLPAWTADGQRRASVTLGALETLWVNTGTLCNLACANCYIDSSPTNDRLAWFRPDDLHAYLDENAAQNVRTIGFTGGEPFMNPHIMALLSMPLTRGHQVLVLTNAMRPLEHHRESMLNLLADYGDALAVRVSIDHYSAALHEAERGVGSWEKAIEGLKWLGSNGFNLSIAGRRPPAETETDVRSGYQSMFDAIGLAIDVADPARLMLFAEMDESADVSEISEDCWSILGVQPDQMMCANSRMVVRRKGAEAPTVVACTLLPDDPQFDLGPTLDKARTSVQLNHPHCARFCVLGGSSCTG